MKQSVHSEHKILLRTCIHIYLHKKYVCTYNELSQKTRFPSVPIAALCLYNIQRDNLVLKMLSVARDSSQFSLNRVKIK